MDSVLGVPEGEVPIAADGVEHALGPVAAHRLDAVVDVPLTLT